MARMRFWKLRTIMFEREITIKELASQIDRCATYLSLRMNGREPFTTTDIKKIATELDIPKTEWVECFMEEWK